MYIFIAIASLEAELTFVYKRIRGNGNTNRKENRWEKAWWKKVDLFDKSVYLSVRDVSCLAIGDNCVISNKVQNAIITICQTFVRQILFKDILETIHFLTFLVFITVFPTIVCNFAREIHLLRRDTPICRTNPLSSTKSFPNGFLVDSHYISP